MKSPILCGWGSRLQARLKDDAGICCLSDEFSSRLIYVACANVTQARCVLPCTPLYYYHRATSLSNKAIHLHVVIDVTKFGRMVIVQQYIKTEGVPRYEAYVD